MNDYQLIDHTADFGLHVKGADPADLFTKAGMALFDVLTDVTKLKGVKTQRIRVEGGDWPDLMVNWLRELLYLWSGEAKLVGAIEIESLDQTEVSATVTYDEYLPQRHQVKNEIKAVTYHQIQVQPVGQGWEARIIFDV
jgi:SHS2 domain-containing protein